MDRLLEMSPKEAGRILGWSVRQIKRLLRAYHESEAAPCVLLVLIDDATGKLVQLLFVELFGYCQPAEAGGTLSFTSEFELG